VLGGGIVGSSAGDLIAEVALAIEMGADAADLALTIHPHPTLSETVAFAAEAFEGTLTDLYLPKRREPAKRRDGRAGSARRLGVGGEIVIKQRSGARTGPDSAAANRSDPVQRERDRERRRTALA